MVEQWRVGADTYDRSTVMIFKQVDSDGVEPIAFLKRSDHQDEDTNLISAAPDLYHACQIALGFVCDGELPIDTPASVASILKAAIKKAEGSNVPS